MTALQGRRDASIPPLPSLVHSGSGVHWGPMVLPAPSTLSLAGYLPNKILVLLNPSLQLLLKLPHLLYGLPTFFLGSPQAFAHKQRIHG